MRRSICISGIIYILSICIHSSIHQIDEYIYQETTENEVEESVWRVEQNGEGAVLTCLHKDGTQIYHLDQILNTLSWQRLDTDSTTILKGNIDNRGDLSVEGIFAGEPIKKEVDLDGLPWMQKYPFSLKSFALSSEKYCEFWALRFADLKPYKLCAKKMGDEMIKSPEGDFQACKIRVSAAGWRSKFYCVYYWYRCKDGMFIRFEGVNGPPGSPKTEIVMRQESTIG